MLSSPLEISLVGGTSLATVGVLISSVAAIRYAWHQGTRVKYEAEGIKLDNEQKRRQAQQESDSELLKSLDEDAERPDAPLLESLAVEGFGPWEPETMSRRRLLDACRAAVALPIELEAVARENRPGQPDPPSPST